MAENMRHRKSILKNLGGHYPTNWCYKKKSKENGKKDFIKNNRKNFPQMKVLSHQTMTFPSSIKLERSTIRHTKSKLKKYKKPPWCFVGWGDRVPTKPRNTLTLVSHE